ncbi:hypothetical protein BK133_09455 [Paenibacillus sp. FSL H8-0548]|uniref:YheC/YheD family endospore coat-associated protein n=1 Tax=Paenibacillus sp. FSL H8-0548 TaxID=1920422 RepID=UPI00096F70D8|nr:YheC/YheD family protein [Paenibacillus sp. FSL H8-0548]OMF35911.1 hypothetical protein BK133_09455 [Paenibacillus sp. FSL H8-0548]
MQARKAILGIVVASIKQQESNRNAEPLLPEPAFYRALSIAGKQLGIDVFVFTADSLKPHLKQLFGYQLIDNRWVHQRVPFPDIIYDRCFFSNANEQLGCRHMLRQLAAIQPYRLLNGALPAKLEVYEGLKADDQLAKHLPVTLTYASAQQLHTFIDRCPGGIILKPSAGMQGRGIIHVKSCCHDRSILITGRTRQNRSFTHTFEGKQALSIWINRFIKGSSYLIQPYLDLSGTDNKPFDVRALIQKDERGRWVLTGTAARVGHSGSLTSNLHGGGEALPASELLCAKFGKPESERLLDQIHTISKQTAERLESKYGRFAELGLDYGIDQSRYLWLLEVNSKPGRSSFRKIGAPLAEQQSIERPLIYAAFLSRRLSPSFVANESANGRRPLLSSDNLLRPFNVQEVHR